MAKYDVTHACGHTVVHDLYGKVKDRESRAEWLAGRVCTECYRAERLASAHAAAAQQGLPDLVGTERQVAWAMTIRAKALAVIDDTIRSYAAIGADLGDRMLAKAEAGAGRAPSGAERDQIQRIIDDHAAVRKAITRMQAEAQAKWWIDNRYNLDIAACSRLSRGLIQAIIRDYAV